jgi:hypothetical protein
MGKHKERLEKLLGELNKSGAALDEPLPDLDLGPRRRRELIF